MKNIKVDSHGYGVHYYSNVVYSLGRIELGVTNNFVFLELDSTTGSLISETKVSAGIIASNMYVNSFYGHL